MKTRKSSFVHRLLIANTIFFCLNLLFFLLFPNVDIFFSNFFYINDVFLDYHFLIIRKLRTFLKNFMIFFSLSSLFLLILIKLNHSQKVLNYKKNLRIKLIVIGFLIGPIIGCGLIANLYFKDNWGRARPYQVEEFGGNLIYTPPLLKSDQCIKNCSWIGGETSAAFSFIAGILFMRKRKIFLKILYFFGSLVIFCRMAMGGHFLSDNLFAVNFMIYLSIIYYFGALKLLKKSSR